MSMIRDENGLYNIAGPQTEEQIVGYANEILLARLNKQPFTMDDPAVVSQYLRNKMSGYEQEVFGCVFLDNRHRVLGIDEIFFGTISCCEVFPREIAKLALQYNAGAIICFHCHPSGIAEPSRADRVITQHIKTVMELINVRVLDHFVIGENEPVSMALRGWV